MDPRWAMVGFDLVHLAAGAIWLGGIAALVVAFRARLDAARWALLVGRFSAAAVVAVVLVTVAGIGMSWIVLPSLDALTSTGYGLALVTKVALVAVVVALGAYNRRNLVPAVSAGAASTPSARRTLTRIVAIELAVLLAVVAVTAVLVARSPVSSSAAPPPVTTAPDAVVVPLSGGAGEASVEVAPARAGSNEIRLVLIDPSGAPLEPVETPTVELAEPALELGPLRPVVHPFGGGTYHVIADIPLAGTWELTVRVRVSEFEAATAETVIDIVP
jgi:copper transport protein